MRRVEKRIKTYNNNNSNGYTAGSMTALGSAKKLLELKCDIHNLFPRRQNRVVNKHYSIICATIRFKLRLFLARGLVAEDYQTPLIE